MRKALFLSMLLAACGGGGAPADDASDEDSSTSGDETQSSHRQSARELLGINPPAVPWSEMSHGDREMDMIGRFHPIYREIFQEHDAERYAEFGCETCHGSDMREREFEMPSSDLPPIPLAGSSQYEMASSAMPEIYEFMEHEVTEPMGTMLGVGGTFTCNGCHPQPN